MPTPLKPPEPGFNRLPPHNMEVERALLGAMLLNNRSYDKVCEFLKPDHFTEAVNGRIYAAMAILIERGSQANPVTLKTYLERDEFVVAAGGIKYLASLSNSMVTVVNVADYGRLIYDLYLRRELISVGEEIVNASFEDNVDQSAEQIIETAEGYLFNLHNSGSAGGGLVSFDQVAERAMVLAETAHRNDGQLVGVTTGMADLDKKMAGLHRGDLLIVAGRPSSGKTGLACSIAYNAAQYFLTTDRDEHKGLNVAFFSLEMPGEQLATRIMAVKAEVESFAVRSGALREDEFNRFYAARQVMANTPLWIDDTPAQTVMHIRARARRLARKGKLGVLIIDYLQLISAPGRERPENRVQEISAITRALKAMAKELDVPVIALSQLSRKVEERDDKRPQLADLRESGSIEQDSDVVMFVFREQYYLERHEPQRRSNENGEQFSVRYGMWQDRLEAVRGMAEIIIGKQRHGPIGTVRLQYNESGAWFSDYIREIPQEDLFS